MKFQRLKVNGDSREFILDGFSGDYGSVHNTMRFDVYDKIGNKNIFIDLPFDDAVKLRDALTGFIDDFAKTAGTRRLDHVASIVADQALTPSERLAMLAEEFRTH